MRTASIFPLRSFDLRPSFWSFSDDLDNVLSEFEKSFKAPNELANFHESEKAYIFTMDMPGVKKEDLSVEREEGFVAISAVRKDPFARKDAQDIKIQRRVKLPSGVDVDNIQAQLRDGVLFLAFPKREEARAQKIEVKDAHEKNFSKLLETSEKKV